MQCMSTTGLQAAAGPEEIRLEMEDAPKAERGTGYSHLAFSVGSRQAVDEWTERLRMDGYPVISGPRVTGDGYYESCILDPEGNRIEITE